MGNKCQHTIAISCRTSRTGTIGALAASLALCFSLVAIRAASAADQPTAETAQTLETVVVTGSLIPQAKAETATPVTVITAEDLQDRGFTTVADALQHLSFATGSVENGQFSGGFTQGAQTLSFFGLSPSYTKYLIDGRPIADYPALYNGTDIIASISGIPTILVDHIDVLPGGQSSIYGSDAIAGVVNIVLKKKMDAPMIDVRYGFTSDGGGTERRLAAADSFSFGTVNIMVGGQYDRTDPIWGYQRDLTATYFTNGSSPQTAERDYLILGEIGDANGNLYYFEDPAGCTNLSALNNASTREYTRPGRGSYCGTINAGYYTIQNGDESTQGYLHASDDLTDHLQLFSDILVNHDVVRFNTGPGFWESDVDPSSPYYLYEDPRLGPDPAGGSLDYLTLVHSFAPEEAGGLNNSMDKNTNNSIRATLGLQGSFGSSNWNYNADWTYTLNKLTERTHVQFSAPLNAAFAPLFGPNLGVDPILGDNLYEPDYAAFYHPVTNAQYNAFSGFANSYSQTTDSTVRGEVTNASLFPLPGGSAGLAVLVEGGDQGWKYAPDPGFLDGDIYEITATAGSGHRSRYAATTELRMPVLKMLTVTASGRYDNYRVSEQNVDKATYNLGLEFRPITTFLLRGRYGTAFKAPTLSDQFQGTSGFFESVTDYYLCAKGGFTGTNIGACPYFGEPVFGTTSGNTKLKPITAKVWDFGAAWSPLERMSITADFIHWGISNEVLEQSVDQLLRIESQCQLGTLNISSPTCVAALSQVVRDPDSGQIISVATPKANVSVETLNVFTLGANYKMVAGRVGNFEFEASWSDLLKHEIQQYPGDPITNELTDPTYSTDFKSKANASVTWTKDKVSGTVYVERYGRTPNYLAQVNGYGTDGAGAVGAWTLCNLSARYQVLSSLELSINVDNVFNTQPPIDHSFPGTAGSAALQAYNETNYNPYGRSFLLEATYKIGK